MNLYAIQSGVIDSLQIPLIPGLNFYGNRQFNKM